MIDQTRLEEYETVESLVKNYPYIFKSEHSLRWLLRHRAQNGLASAVRKVGKRLLIHRPSIELWIDKNCRCH